MTPLPLPSILSNQAVECWYITVSWICMYVIEEQDSSKTVRLPADTSVRTTRFLTVRFVLYVAVSHKTRYRPKSRLELDSWYNWYSWYSWYNLSRIYLLLFSEFIVNKEGYFCGHKAFWSINVIVTFSEKGGNAFTFIGYILLDIGYQCSWKIEEILWCFYCRRSAVFHWRCWRQCWCGRLWCCIQVTLSVMMTAIHTRVASPGVLHAERLLCCARSARPGITLWRDGRNHQHDAGWDISWGSWLNVSI